MQTNLLPLDDAPAAVPIHFVTAGSVAGVLEQTGPSAQAWASAHGFKGTAGEILIVPDAEGAPLAVLFGAPDTPEKGLLSGSLATSLPAGDYRLTGDVSDPALSSLAFALGGYRFDRYRKTEKERPRLVIPDAVDGEDVNRIAAGVCLARDLINTPANDMGPAELEHAVRHLADTHGATLQVITGDALIENGLPMIHAVGRASDRAPRLIDMQWTGGDAKAPKVTLVGKGVCFDTGGLDLKPSSGMLLMKKDMGGAAATIGLASMIMDAGLPVRLRLLVPAVENSVSGSAFRPGDVLQSRKGLTVEIGNTDAEGRLVLADALALADEEKPDLMIDMATLTGAARVALGTEVMPFFTNDDALAADLDGHGAAVADPVWRLPLWAPYESLLKSKVADINNAGSSRFGGAITAALFLARFVEQAKQHVHFDIFGWVPSARPGQPEGGEAQAVRALFSMLKDRYGV